MEHSASPDVLLVEDMSQQRLPARSLAAALRRAGLSARLAHFGAGTDPDDIVALARRESPRLVVLSILFAFLVEENLALAARLRAAGVAAHLTMVGPLPTFAYADLLAACPALDSVLRGEAEASIVNLATSLNFKTDWRATPGLAYRSPSAGPDTLQVNPLPPPIANLDGLPFPARDDGLPERLGFGFATVESSQGCYHACAFCLPSAFYRSSVRSCYRLRSIPNLMEEMEALYRQGTRLFLFDDEQFLPPGQARGERVRALGDALQRRGLDIAFTIKCRPDDVDETLLGRLKAMGLIRVYLGVESGCQASLDRLGKVTTVEQNASALAILDRLGIVTDFRSLLFHPWSTPQTVRSDLGFMAGVLPLVATPFVFSEVGCYPGTPLGEQLRAEGRAGAGSEAIGGLSYLIADPGVELLRRMGRVVFGRRDAESGIPSQIAQAWFDHLLLRRFQPERYRADQARRLRESVARLNRASLAIWQEMLSFVAAGDLYDAARVNEQVAAWAGRVNAVDVAVETGLAS
jgi:anaerobic magnesium-protoporphyrin IX monomethyl ester cyclase